MSDEPSQVSMEMQADSPAKPEQRERRRRRLVPPLRVWLVVAACVVATVVVRVWDAFHDHAIGNIVTLIGGFIALVWLLLWFCLASGHSRKIRMTILASAILVVATLCGVYKIDGVWGELFPRFTFRWARDPDELLEKRPPADSAAADAAAVDISAGTEYDFPQFLGPNRNATVRSVRLSRDWSADTWQTPLWRREIGAGWSGFSAVAGYAFTMEQRGESEMVTCYDVQTGRMIWWQAVQARYDTILGGIGPRATPTVDSGRVYTLGAKAMFQCLDAATGKLLWRHDLLEEFGIDEKEEDKQVCYGRSNSPLVIGDLVVIPAGGPLGGRRYSLVAYDKATGETVWRGGEHQVSYSSPARATLGGVEQILIVCEDFLSSHDPATGKVLWEHDWPGKSQTNANVSQAVPVGDDRVFLSKGYGGGAALLKIKRPSEGTWAVDEIWPKSPVMNMKTKFTNVAVRSGYVYGLDDGILECIELETGRKRWKRGRYGHGQILLVGELLLVQAESGEVVLVEASPEKLNELGRFQAVDDQTWNNLCLYGPYLLVRNAREAACYKLPLANE